MAFSSLIWAIIAAVLLLGVALLFASRSKRFSFSERREVVEVFSEFAAAGGREQGEIAWVAFSEDGTVGFVEMRNGELAILANSRLRSCVRMIGEADVEQVALSRDRFTLSFKLAGWLWPKMVTSFEDAGVALYTKQVLEKRLAKSH